MWMTQTLNNTVRGVRTLAGRRCWRPGLMPVVMLATISLGLPDRSWAGQFNPVLDIGDQAPRWQQLQGVDGQRHSWQDVADADCVLVVFTCNSCPYAVDVEDRLIELAQRFPTPRLRVVAINVNLVEDDRLPAMKRRADEKSFPFPYLHDPSQQIAKQFGALRTPEFFVLDGAGNVAYMGALDDSPDGSQVTTSYVADAITAVLAGSLPETRETVPIGCRIRFTRSDRRRR